jgi:hypothetical protein
MKAVQVGGHDGKAPKGHRRHVRNGISVQSANNGPTREHMTARGIARSERLPVDERARAHPDQLAATHKTSDGMAVVTASLQLTGMHHTGVGRQPTA